MNQKFPNTAELCSGSVGNFNDFLYLLGFKIRSWGFFKTFQESPRRGRKAYPNEGRGDDYFTNQQFIKKTLLTTANESTNLGRPHRVDILAHNNEF